MSNNTQATREQLPMVKAGASPAGMDAASNLDIHDCIVDAYYGKMGAEFKRKTQERIHWVCSQVHGNSVLDVGCSQGIAPILLGREGKTVQGIDSDLAAIQVAQEHLAMEPPQVQGRVTFLNADFLVHQFTGARFDSVIMSDVLEHLVNPRIFIDQAASLLIENGHLIVTVPFGISESVGHKRTCYLFEPYKLLSQYFDVADVQIFGRWVGLVGCRRKRPRSDKSALWLGEELLRQIEAAFYQIEREVQGKLTETRARLDDAGGKYWAVTEQVVSLKQKTAQEEAARQATAMRLAQLEATLRELEAEKRGRLQQVEALHAEVKAQTEAAHEAQEQVIRSNAAVEGLRSLLEAENLKCREATQRHGEFKEQLAQERAAHQAAATRLMQLQAQSEVTARGFEGEKQSRLAQLEALSAELRARTEAAHEAQKQVIRSDATVEGLRSRLDTVTLKHREATQRQGELKEQLTQEQAARQATAMRLAQLEVTVRDLESEKQGRQNQVEALSAELKAQTQAVHEAQKQAARSDATVEGLRSQLDAANLKCREAMQGHDTLEDQLVQEQAARQAANSQIEQLKRDTLRTKHVLAKAGRDVERLRNEKLLADNRVAQTRAMISFQLGYALLHGFKSAKGAVGLPKALWRIYGEAKRRKREKNESRERNGKAQAFVLRNAAALASKPVPAPLLPATPVKSRTLQEGVSLEQRLKLLKVACIMDEFTYGSYTQECNLLQLTPAHWHQELEGFKPELLFIESAWRGKDELWGSKVGHLSQEVQDILTWCREHQVPTVFWNKEDPIHFETFLTTARLFDHVFTTDIDCIHRYKAALGHERVYLLPFAAQPALSNPIEKYGRKDAFCFAGAYYVRYPERTRDLGNFVSQLAEYRPVEIYDRNFGKDDPNYKFPPEYEPFIVGNLPFEQIDKAYKGYRYAINLNSIKQSQTMFARRVFELLASNTITVSNFSRGVRLLFGDLVITTDNGSEIVRRLQALGRDDAQVRKFRLAGLRKVMMNHTYQDRLAYVVSKVQGRPLERLLPGIAVTAYAKNQKQFDALLGSYNRQTYAERRFIVVVPADFAPEGVPDDGSVQVLPANAIKGQTLADVLGETQLVAGWVPDDYYGPNYLLDLALATRYSKAQGFGKLTHHVCTANNGLSLAFPNCQYRPAKQLPARCATVHAAAIGHEILRDWVTSLYTRQIEALELLAIDEFNYCKNGSGAGFGTAQADTVNDLPSLDEGLSARELTARAESIAPEETTPDAAPVLTGAQLAGYFKPSADKGYTFSVVGAGWEAVSTLADGKHDYVYAATDFRLADLRAAAHVQFHLDITPGLNLQLAMFFLDAQKQRIGHIVKSANRNQEAAVPAGTEYIRLGLRIYGGGAARINALVLGHRPLRPAEVLGRAEHLVLTNHYPSYDDLYRNGFVHSRVAAYAKRGVKVDVFRLRKDEALSYHEFHNVDAITGSQDALHKLLSGGRYKSVLVHFLDEAMWGVLQHYIEQVKVIVWVHGAEIQPWHRRDYNLGNDEQRQTAKMRSDARLQFWRSLLQDMPDNLQLVLVSNYFAEEVMEDLGFRLPQNKYRIIHNPIDTQLFAYFQKPSEQRKKILSIRPYASRTYANDLSVQTILALSTKPWFRELEFRMIGDGVLFDDVLAPIRKFDNVVIERRFLSQSEISQLHREYGIFLCPTRMDTHGVSRDEAMASGLVPVTNAVAAIPEFTNDTCAILCPSENYQNMAEGICKLYEDPDIFHAMSKAAAGRVRSQSDSNIVIHEELKLFSMNF